MRNQTKIVNQRILAWILSLCMMLSLLPVSSVIANAAPAESAQAITFTNTSGDGGLDVISMSEQRSFSATFALPEDLKNEGEKVAEEIAWSLTRDHGTLNEEQYPFYYKGDTLEAFTNINASTSRRQGTFFKDIKTTYDAASNTITLTFAQDYFGGLDNVNNRSCRIYMMDYIGYYDLKASYNGKVIAQTSVKFNAYDSYHTMDEFYSDIDAIVAKAAGLDNLYVKKLSLGKSTSGLDMPYMIMAKDAKVLDKWLELCEKAETQPEELIKAIEDGSIGDFQVPVLYSNIHSDETSGADCVLEVAWDIVNAAAGEETQINYLTGLTDAGKEQLAYEREARGQITSELTKQYTYYLGELTGSKSSNSTKVDLDKYYNVEKGALNKETLAKLLEDIFFIIVPEENVDGRTYNTRYAQGGVDLNRDNSFQTQVETQNMTRMIGQWNPVSFLEMHGFVSAFQAEPCDPPHEPNFEYDILAEHLMTGGESFAAGAVANNWLYNSCVMPQRDYLVKDTTGKGSTGAYWADPWDDMSTSYTPQFAMLHGTVSYTVELPAANEAATLAGEYGLLTHSFYVASDKASYLKNQCRIYARGIKNEDADSVRPWYTDVYDAAGAEADIFRPKYEENNNFFPECYIIPLDAANQKNLDSAYDMLNWLVRNDVKVNLTKDAFTYKGVTYPAGTMIVSMYQAKRSVANGALYDGVVVEGWPALYSEPITAFNFTRGFDSIPCTNADTYKTITSILDDAIVYNEEANYVELTPASKITGVAGYDVILSNTSTDATAAVNELLKNEKTVAMFTEGEHKGDFLVSYEDYLTVASKYVLTGIGTDAKPEGARVISGAPKVYINGVPTLATYGYILYNFVSNSSSSYNFDRQSYAMMNFDVAATPAEADFIVGNRGFTTDSLAAVQKGTPYIGYGTTVLSSVRSNLFTTATFNYKTVSRAMDALFYCAYPEESMTTASKVTHGDNVMYGYGLGYITTIPAGAKVLATVDGTVGEGKSDDILLEGFIPAGQGEDEFIDSSIQGMSYEGPDKNGNMVDVTVFANTLTNKMHQEDEFNLISSTIFSKMLTKKAYDFSKTEIKKLQEASEELQNANKDLLAEIDALKKANTADKATIEDLKKSVSANETAIAKLEKQIADLKAETDATNTANDDRFAKIEEELATLAAANEKLENMVAKLTFQANKTKIKSVKSTSKKTMTVVVKKMAGAEGYQIKYSTNKNLKNAKTKNITATSVKIKSLKSKKTYYVKARAYVTIAGEKVYAKFSTVKKVKVK